MRNINDLNLTHKKYIIFDMDGTLIDSIGIWNKIDQIIIKKYGHKVVALDTIQKDRDNFTDNHTNTDIYLAYCSYLIKKYSLSIANPQEILKIRWDNSLTILMQQVNFKPNAVELILRLKQLGYIMVLATMTSEVQIDIYCHKNKQMTKAMNIKEVFDLIITKENVTLAKPDPEIYNNVIKHYQALKEECLVFEDSYTGILACKRAGIECVNVYDSYADMNRSKIDALTDYKIENYQEILRLINKI